MHNRSWALSHPKRRCIAQHTHHDSLAPFRRRARIRRLTRVLRWLLGLLIIVLLLGGLTLWFSARSTPASTAPAHTVICGQMRQIVGDDIHG